MKSVATRKLGVIVFILAFSLVGFDECALFGLPDNDYGGLDVQAWTATNLNGSPQTGFGWFLKSGDNIKHIKLSFSQPYEGNVMIYYDGVYASGQPFNKSAPGSFVYDGGSPGTVKLDFKSLRFNGDVNFGELATTWRHGTIQIKHVLQNQNGETEEATITYSR